MTFGNLPTIATPEPSTANNTATVHLTTNQDCVDRKTVDDITIPATPELLPTNDYQEAQQQEEEASDAVMIEKSLLPVSCLNVDRNKEADVFVLPKRADNWTGITSKKAEYDLNCAIGLCSSKYFVPASAMTDHHHKRTIEERVARMMIGSGYRFVSSVQPTAPSLPPAKRRRYRIISETSNRVLDMVRNRFEMCHVTVPLAGDIVVTKRQECHGYQTCVVSAFDVNKIVLDPCNRFIIPVEPNFFYVLNKDQHYDVIFAFVEYELSRKRFFPGTRLLVVSNGKEFKATFYSSSVSAKDGSLRYKIHYDGNRKDSRTYIPASSVKGFLREDSASNQFDLLPGERLLVVSYDGSRKESLTYIPASSVDGFLAEDSDNTLTAFPKGLLNQRGQNNKTKLQDSTQTTTTVEQEKHRSITSAEKITPTPLKHYDLLPGERLLVVSNGKEFKATFYSSSVSAKDGSLRYKIHYDGNRKDSRTYIPSSSVKGFLREDSNKALTASAKDLLRKRGSNANKRRRLL